MYRWIIVTTLGIYFLTAVQEGSSSWRQIAETNCVPPKPTCTDIMLCQELVNDTTVVKGWACLSLKSLQHFEDKHTTSGAGNETEAPGGNATTAGTTAASAASGGPVTTAVPVVTTPPAP